MLSLKSFNISHFRNIQVVSNKQLMRILNYYLCIYSTSYVRYIYLVKYQVFLLSCLYVSKIFKIQYNKYLPVSLVLIHLDEDPHYHNVFVQFLTLFWTIYRTPIEIKQLKNLLSILLSTKVLMIHDFKDRNILC